MAAIEQRRRCFAVPRRNASRRLSDCTRAALGRFASQTETTNGFPAESYAYDLKGNKRALSPRRSSRATAISRPVRRVGAGSRFRRRSGNCHRTNSLVAADLRAAEYDAQDRLLSSGEMTYYTHDANGNQFLTPNSSLLTSYSYDRDALNRVTAKRVNGAVTQGRIYKDGLAPIAETDAEGNVVSFFVYGTSALSPDYMIKDGATYRLIRDFAGSVRLVVNADTGAIAQRLDYDSFGNVSQDTNPGFQPFGFKSGLYDSDTGLVHFGARWYDPATGRWISKDPILLQGGLNLYAFCGNDPVNFSDPWGLCESYSPSFIDATQTIHDSMGTVNYPIEFWKDFSGGMRDFLRRARDRPVQHLMF